MSWSFVPKKEPASVSAMHGSARRQITRPLLTYRAAEAMVPSPAESLFVPSAQWIGNPASR